MRHAETAGKAQVGGERSSCAAPHPGATGLGQGGVSGGGGFVDGQGTVRRPERQSESQRLPTLTHLRPRINVEQPDRLQQLARAGDERLLHLGAGTSPTTSAMSSNAGGNGEITGASAPLPEKRPDPVPSQRPGRQFQRRHDPRVNSPACPTTRPSTTVRRTDRDATGPIRRAGPPAHSGSAGDDPGGLDGVGPPAGRPGPHQPGSPGRRPARWPGAAADGHGAPSAASSASLGRRSTPSRGADSMLSAGENTRPSSNSDRSRLPRPMFR